MRGSGPSVWQIAGMGVGGPVDATQAAHECTSVRSTVLVSSIQALRTSGHYDAYAAKVDPSVKGRLVTLGAPAWLPIDLAQAHYRACDALGLPSDEVRRVSASLALVHVSGVDVLLRAARAGGVSPWTIFSRAPTYWDRMYMGGRLVVHQDGPKDARLVVHGQSLAELAYWRAGFAGIVSALADSLSTRAYVNEARARGVATFAISWA
jgi:hypothetical protein